MNNKTNTVIGIIVAVIVVALIIYFAMRGPAAPTTDTGTPATMNETALMPTESMEDTSTGSIHAAAGSTSPVASISYTDALVAYKDRRIQFDQKCAATPFTVTFKNNTDIMIDNRSSINRTFNIGGAVPVSAWGFKIINLSSSTLPATYKIDCGAGQNVATVTIQK